MWCCPSQGSSTLSVSHNVASSGQWQFVHQATSAPLAAFITVIHQRRVTRQNSMCCMKKCDNVWLSECQHAPSSPTSHGWVWTCVNMIIYVAIMTLVVRLVLGMFTPFPGHIRTCLNEPPNAISVLTPIIALTPCDGSKKLSLYLVYLCVLFIEQQMVT